MAARLSNGFLPPSGCLSQWLWDNRLVPNSAIATVRPFARKYFILSLEEYFCIQSRSPLNQPEAPERNQAAH